VRLVLTERSGLRTRRAIVALLLATVTAACGDASDEGASGSSTTTGGSGRASTTSSAAPATSRPVAETTTAVPTTLGDSSATALPGASTSTSAASTTAASVPPPPPATIAPPSTAATPVVCEARSGFVGTPSGRRVLLRTAGATPLAPLVVVLHGYTGTPTGIERFAELTGPANTASVAVAYPEGTATRDDGFGWASGAGVFATEGVDDVAALAEMLDAVVATGCVDPARVVLAGESNGAGMALAAACDGRVGPRLASLVLVNAAVDEDVVARCAAGAPVALPVSAIAGEIDATVPFAGGNGLLAQEEWFGAVSWLIAGCHEIAPRAQIDDWTAVVAGTSCETCSVLFAVADGTHTWPGSSRGTGGLRPGTFDLNQRILWSAAAPPPLPCLPW